MSGEPTLEQFREYLDYNPHTGLFTWIKSRSRVPAGTVVSHIDQYGYVRLCFNKKMYYAHRLAWLFCYETWPKNYIDHIDRDRSNNRIFNLRDVSRSINELNKTSEISITKAKNRWRARVCVTRKEIHLGYYSSKEEASAATKGLKEKLIDELYQYEQTCAEYKEEDAFTIAQSMIESHLLEHKVVGNKLLDEMKKEGKFILPKRKVIDV